MSGPGECARIRLGLGVYVLGAIAPADRAMVDRHLASCRQCRDELAGLAGLPALLRRVPAPAMVQLSGERQDDRPGPAGGLLDGLLLRVATVRSRRRWRLAAAAAVLAVAAAGWVPSLLLPAVQPHQAVTSWWAATAGGFDPATGVGAAVHYTPRPWGTELEASVRGIPPGTACQIWAITASGQHAAGGGWTVARGDPHAWYPASVPFTAASLDGFDITAHGQVLVIIPLRPGTMSAYTQANADLRMPWQVASAGQAADARNPPVNRIDFEGEFWFPVPPERLWAVIERSGLVAADA